MTALPEAAVRVADAARALGLDVTIREMPASTRTAEEAAAACGCTVARIAKSLVFRGRVTGTPFLLLVSGAHRVDETAVAAALGEPLARTDAADVRALTGYAIGGIPPFGHATALATFIDETLLGFETVWAAAGTPRCVFEIAPADLARAAAARPIAVTSPSTST